MSGVDSVAGCRQRSAGLRLELRLLTVRRFLTTPPVHCRLEPRLLAVRRVLTTPPAAPLAGFPGSKVRLSPGRSRLHRVTMAALEAVDQVEGLVFEGKFDEACGHMRMICIPLAVSGVPVCVCVRLAPSLVGIAIT